MITHKEIVNADEPLENNYLELVNSEINNFYYGMNSLVNMTSQGAQISF